MVNYCIPARENLSLLSQALSFDTYPIKINCMIFLIPGTSLVHHTICRSTQWTFKIQQRWRNYTLIVHTPSLYKLKFSLIPAFLINKPDVNNTNVIKPPPPTNSLTVCCNNFKTFSMSHGQGRHGYKEGEKPKQKIETFKIIDGTFLRNSNVKFFSLKIRMIYFFSIVPDCIFVVNRPF